MNTFIVDFLAPDRVESVDGVTSFVGEDETGCFGLMACHERFMTVLVDGLVRLRLADGQLRYAGLPGGLATFRDGRLSIVTRRLALGDDAAAIGKALAHALVAEQGAMDRLMHKLHRLEADMLRRLAQLDRR